MFFLSDYQIEFARKLGSKDKEKRFRRSRNMVIGLAGLSVGSTPVIGYYGYKTNPYEEMARKSFNFPRNMSYEERMGAIKALAADYKQTHQNIQQKMKQGFTEAERQQVNRFMTNLKEAKGISNMKGLKGSVKTTLLGAGIIGTAVATEKLLKRKHKKNK